MVLLLVKRAAMVQWQMVGAGKYLDFELWTQLAISSPGPLPTTLLPSVAHAPVLLQNSMLLEAGLMILP